MASQPMRTLRPEDEVSHYKVVGPLGAGGMGEVYLAQDLTLGRNVAIKILPPELVRSEERVRRFVLEAKSASSLSHPNIVTIYEIGESPVRSSGEPDSDPLHFISMELVSGKTLGTLIHEDKTDLRTLLGYLAQAADGLAKAHAAGIVHRDLKPGNIMVSSDGFAKVLDFGLAKLTEKREMSLDATSGPTVGPDVTQEGMVVGTAAYMSPEQVRGKGVDHRSDIFSFGCILYEAATRRRPFDADTGVEMMNKILNEKPVPVEEINDKVPAELRRLIRRCLSKSADQRLQSIKDLSLELREIVDEYDALSASASSGSMVSGATPVAAAARRIPVAVWIGVTVLVAGAIGGALWMSKRAGNQAQPYQTMRVSTLTNRGDVDDCVLSPDGRFLGYLAGDPGQLSLRVRQVATGSDVEVVPAANLQIFNPSFSPDGNYLFYTAARKDNPSYRALYQVPSLGGQPRERAFDVDSRASFAPDGKRLVFWRHLVGDDSTNVVVLDLDTNKETVLGAAVAPEQYLGSPQWSPDGKRIAVALFRPAPDFKSTVAFFDVSNGKRQDLGWEAQFVLSSIAWLHDGSAIVACGQDIRGTLTPQIYQYSYPSGRKSRVTNDFNGYDAISASQADATIAATRRTLVSNVWVADAAGGAAKRITSAANPENSPFIEGVADSVTIIYTAPDGQHVQLWAMDFRGEAVRALTSGGAHSVNPEVSGATVVFNRIDESGMHVWRIQSDGTGLRQLTSGQGEPLGSISRDGRYATIGFFGQQRTTAVISTEDGRELRKDIDASGSMGLSPDGKNLLIGLAERDAQGLMRTRWRLVPAEGGPPTASMRFPAQAFDLRWAPGGQSVSFLDRADPAWNVFRQPIPGGAPGAVTHFTQGRLTAHEWSNDGRRLAVLVRVGKVVNVWVTDADGGNALQVTQFTGEQVFGMHWTPDNRRIVLSAGISSADAVSIKDFR